MYIIDKKNMIFITTLLAAVVFTACSDNASFSSDTAQFSKERITIDVNCTTPAIIEDYISLKQGDIITKIEENTSIITYHDINDVKKICINYGKADILRDSE